MTPVTSVAVPIPTRLMTGLKVSATQPNSVMPSIAKAMVPVLKTPNTRASISFGRHFLQSGRDNRSDQSRTPPNEHDEQSGDDGHGN